MRVDRLDGMAGLYLLRSADKSPLYLGETTDLGRRLAMHKGSRTLDRVVTQASILPVDELPSAEYLAPLWSDLVRRYAPRFNVGS